MSSNGDPSSIPLLDQNTAQSAARTCARTLETEEALNGVQQQSAFRWIEFFIVWYDSRFKKIKRATPRRWKLGKVPSKVYLPVVISFFFVSFAVGARFPPTWFGWIPNEEANTHTHTHTKQRSRRRSGKCRTINIALGPATVTELMPHGRHATPRHPPIGKAKSRGWEKNRHTHTHTHTHRNQRRHFHDIPRRWLTSTPRLSVGAASPDSPEIFLYFFFIFACLTITLRFFRTKERSAELPEILLLEYGEMSFRWKGNEEQFFLGVLFCSRRGSHYSGPSVATAATERRWKGADKRRKWRRK